MMTGAGISVSAGVPDFRTPDTGIYDRIELLTGMKLPYKEALFDVKYFIKHPQAYYLYRKERMKEYDFTHELTATPAHYFIRLLKEKCLLHKVFTQNTDELHLKCGGLEEEEDVIHAHGHNGSAVCAVCRAKDSLDEFSKAARIGEVRYC